MLALVDVPMKSQQDAFSFYCNWHKKIRLKNKLLDSKVLLKIQSRNKTPSITSLLDATFRFCQEQVTTTILNFGNTW